MGTVGTVAMDRVLPALPTTTIALTVTAGLLIAAVGSLAVAAWHLLLAVLPRLDTPAGTNRFAFPSLVAAGSPAHATLDLQRDEAWDYAVTIARIAAEKHQRVRRSMSWLVVTALSTAGLVALVHIAAS
ncbi:hypothetical protein ACN28G_15120 [Micromonospora sp. WMMA1923]|uniref:hypothetical protein n=1 Tax=Micromonospora sp. WMMA1923 TaxID=3404125 RepID=UPI003B95D46F